MNKPLKSIVQYRSLRRQAERSGLDGWEQWPKLCGGISCSEWIGIKSDYIELAIMHDGRIGAGPYILCGPGCLATLTISLYTKVVH